MSRSEQGIQDGGHENSLQRIEYLKLLLEKTTTEHRGDKPSGFGVILDNGDIEHDCER